MEALQLLSRNEMKMINGGIIQEDCGIYVDGEWDCGYTSAEAQGNFVAFDNVTGYCCASCGEEGFLGSPC